VTCRLNPNDGKPRAAAPLHGSVDPPPPGFAADAAGLASASVAAIVETNVASTVCLFIEESPCCRAASPSLKIRTLASEFFCRIRSSSQTYNQIG
jgi:hypothetical protein